MVSQSLSLDRLFHALADPTRRAMLRRLAVGEHNLRTLAEPFRMTFPAASKHVRVLEAAGLVRRKVQGRCHVCRIVPAPLAAADEWLRFYRQFWNQRLDALERVLHIQDGSQAAAQGSGPDAAAARRVKKKKKGKRT